MTVHAHDPAAHGGETLPAARATERRSTTGARPWWLVPGVVVAMVVGALVIAGVLPLSIVLYGALFGGCVLMHVVGHGGHGGGGHATHGDGHAAHDGTTTSEVEDLRQPSPGSQGEWAVSKAGLEDRPAKTPTEEREQTMTNTTHTAAADGARHGIASTTNDPGAISAPSAPGSAVDRQAEYRTVAPVHGERRRIHRSTTTSSRARSASTQIGLRWLSGTRVHSTWDRRPSSPNLPEEVDACRH